MSKEARKRLLEWSSRTLFVCIHSGGKDSQAMFKWLYDHVPREHLIVNHARLPGADWEGTLEHIQKTCEDIPVFSVKANKTFFEMVEHRGMWPSPALKKILGYQFYKAKSIEGGVSQNETAGIINQKKRVVLKRHKSQKLSGISS